MLSVNSDGIVLFAGIYQIIPLKTLFFYIVAGCASVLSYLITAKEKKTFSGILNHLAVGIFVAFMIGGAVSDIFNKDITAWVSALLGFFAYPILKKLIQNTDRLVNALYAKIFKRLGIEEEDLNDDTKSTN